jgi:histidine phosphotransferase ChpT
MKTKVPLRLAELLTSRLCHDLITPIGAINTGLELFQETASQAVNEEDEIMQLILNSAQTASARVSFYRVAFGNGGGHISLENAKELIDKYFARSKLHLQWKEESHQIFPFEKWGRLLLNTVLWMGECAPRGGTLHISTPREGKPVLSLCLKADSIILHQGTLEALEGKVAVEEITPRTAHCYLVNQLVEDERGTIAISKTSSPSELTLEIRMGESG